MRQMRAEAVPCWGAETMLALINLRRQASAGGLWAASGPNGTGAPYKSLSPTDNGTFSSEKSTHMGPLKTLAAKVRRRARAALIIGAQHVVVRREEQSRTVSHLKFSL